MDLLNQMLILALVSASPWPGKRLHDLASGEVSYARHHLEGLFSSVFAIASFFSMFGFLGLVRVILALLLGLSVLRFPMVLIGALMGIGSAISLYHSVLYSPSIYIIAGIIIGSLYPKKESLVQVSVACAVVGILVLLLL